MYLQEWPHFFKELELFGPEKAPQRYLFEKYQIKKEKQSNEKD